MPKKSKAETQFQSGCDAGPGRPAAWSTLIKRELNHDRRREIVKSAIAAACDGDASARDWLIQVLDERQSASKAIADFSIDDVLANATEQEAAHIARKCIDWSVGLR